MSEPEYILRVHKSAESELGRVTGEPGERLIKRLRELKKHEQPTELNYVKQLEDHKGLYAVKVNGYRCLFCLNKPAIQVLLVDTRARVYGRIDTAKKRGRID